MIRRTGNRVFDDNFKTDRLVLEFVENEWTNRAKSDFVTDHNFGKQMLDIYGKYRDSMHISNVMEMLKEMEENWGKYSYERFENRQKE